MLLLMVHYNSVDGEKNRRDEAKTKKQRHGHSF